MTQMMEMSADDGVFKLNDKVATTLYTEWRAKAVGYHTEKEYDVCLDTNDAISTKDGANAADATDEVKKLYEANKESLRYIETCCSGLPLKIADGAADLREAIADMHAQQ
jgi:molybdopterin/thiamine biosynthesis adenylyltransferase